MALGRASDRFKISSAYNGAIYWEPIGNAERSAVLRSAVVTGRANRINVMLNWQADQN